MADQINIANLNLGPAGPDGQTQRSYIPPHVRRQQQAPAPAAPPAAVADSPVMNGSGPAPANGFAANGPGLNSSAWSG